MPNAAAASPSLELKPLEFPSRTRLVFGAGQVNRLGTLTRELGARQVLLVTDAGIVKAGHAGRAVNQLEAVGLRVTVFDQARENPTTRCVDDCVRVAKAAGIDTIIGLGGGSSMDTAKGCNFLLTNGGQMQDYWGVSKATQPMLPFIAIPTTAGTGSELQSAALIADEATHQKMACLDPKCAASLAILDPELTLSQPTRVTACTGIDAIAHAVETAVTTKRNDLSQRLSREALRLCLGALPEVLAHPDRLAARARMQLGAAYAGAAIENSMLGAAHAAANPLTAHFGIVHGHAVGLMLPHVIRFNAREEAARRTYLELANTVPLGANGGPAIDALCERLRGLLATAGLSTSLAECQVRRDSIARLADEAARQWTATFNPRPLTLADFITLYESAWS